MLRKLIFCMMIMIFAACFYVQNASAQQQDQEPEFVGIEAVSKLADHGRRQISRPEPDKGPTKVYVSLFVVDVDDIDTVKQNFTAALYMQFVWQDSRLAHNGPGKVFYALTDVWTPQVQLVNKQRTFRSFPEVVEVTISGEVTYRQRIWGGFSQPLELKDFPFDKQNLDFQFVSVGNTVNEVEFLKNPKLSIVLSERFSLPDWEVLGWEYTSDPFVVLPGQIEAAGVKLTLHVLRGSGHYVFKVIIPLILIVMMSWVAFWIDPKQLGTNVAAVMTSMLTLVAYRFAIGDYLPNVSYLTRIDWFILLSTLLVFTGLMQVVLNWTLVCRGSTELARRIDQSGRFLYPIAFILIILWSLCF